MNTYYAIHTAIKAHAHQVRKLDGDIYAAHPIEVGLILSKSSVPDEVVIAGILHDTLEDTPLTPEDIEKDFGEIVLKLVQGCSEKDKSLSWQERKDETLLYIRTEASHYEKLIMCADKLSNIRSLYRHLDNDDDKLWDKFNAGYERQKWYYTSVRDAMTDLSHHPIYEEFCDYVKKVFEN